MDSELSYKLIKYLGQGIIIYLLFKLVPKEPMNDKDILLITSIVILAYAVLENLYTFYTKNDQQLSPAQCNAQCAVKENMASISYVPKTEAESEMRQQIKQMQITQQQVVDQLTANAAALAKQREEQDKQLAAIAASSSSSNNSSLPIIKQEGIVRNDDGSFTFSSVTNPQNQIGNGGQVGTDGSNVISNELGYTASNFTDYNSLPVPTNWDSWDNGSSYLPPPQWFPVPPHPPNCIKQDQCPVCPIYTNGTNIELKEWNGSRRISQPYDINTQYIQDKLNTNK